MLICPRNSISNGAVFNHTSKDADGIEDPTTSGDFGVSDESTSQLPRVRLTAIFQSLIRVIF